MQPVYEPSLSRKWAHMAHFGDSVLNFCWRVPVSVGQGP